MAAPRPAGGMPPPLSRYDLAARLMMDPATTDDVLRRPAEEVDAAVAEAQRGTYLLKFGRSGRPQKRFVRVTDEGDALYWVSRRKKRADSTLSFAFVERLQRGQHTSVFARHSRDYGHLAPLCLSIVAAGGFRSLDLAFESPRQLDTWTVALTALLLRQRAGGDDSDTRQLWRAFAAEDAAGGGHGAIGYGQTKALLRRLNVYQAKRRLKALYAGVVQAEEEAAAAAAAATTAAAAAATEPPPAPAAVPRVDGDGQPVPPSAAVAAAAAVAATDSRPLVPPSPEQPQHHQPQQPQPHQQLLTFQGFLRLVDLLRDRPDIRGVYTSLLAQHQLQQQSLQQPQEPHQPVTGDAHAASSSSAVALSLPATLSSQQTPPPTSAPSVQPQQLAAAAAFDLLPVAAFHSFLVHEQGEGAAVTLDAARRLAGHYDPPHGGDAISLPAFTAFLTSAGNAAFAPQAASVGWHDMSRPLAHYFIDSSHNTYLEGDQVQGAASVSAYISVVQKGCRCVELDCWDGPGGEPVIYHGHTLTGRVPFADVCRALRDYGFVASPFPLILSLEVHCSPRQQERMAAILVDTFGPALAAPLSEPAAGAGAGGGGGSARSLLTTTSTALDDGGGSTADGWRPRSSSDASQQSHTTLVVSSSAVVPSHPAGVGHHHAGLLSPSSEASVPLSVGLSLDEPPPLPQAPPPVPTLARDDDGAGVDVDAAAVPAAALVLRSPAANAPLPPSSTSNAGGGGGVVTTAPAAVDGAAAPLPETPHRSAHPRPVPPPLPLLSMQLDALPSPLALLRRVVVKAKVARKGESGAAAASAAPSAASAGSKPSSRPASTHGSPRSEHHGGVHGSLLPPSFLLPPPAAAGVAAGAGSVHTSSSPVQAPHSYVRSVLPPAPAPAPGDARPSGASAAVASAPPSPTRPLAASGSVPAAPLPGPASAAGSSDSAAADAAAAFHVLLASDAPVPASSSSPSMPVAPPTGGAPPPSSSKARSRASSLSLSLSSSSAAASSLLSRVGRKLSLSGGPAVAVAAAEAAALPAPPSSSSAPTSSASSSALLAVAPPPTPLAGAAAATSSESVIGTGAAAVTSAAALPPPPKPLLTPGLRSLVFLAALPFESLEACASSGQRCWHMCSLKEPKAAKLLARSGAGPLLAHTTRQLVRVYPGPLRLNSSNFHAGPYFACGVQMVALNHQTHDVPMRVMRAFFRLNGRCGFVLKPAYMRSRAAIAALHPGAAVALLDGDDGDGGSGVETQPAHVPGPPVTEDRGDAAAPGALVTGKDAPMTPELQPGVGDDAPPLPAAAPPPPGPVGGGGALIGSTSKWLRGAGGDALFSALPPSAQASSLQRIYSFGSLKRSLSGVWQHHHEQQHPPGSTLTPGAPPPPPLLLQPRPDGPDAFTLVVTLMGAQHLPKRGGGEVGGVPSPYCSVGIHGDPADRLKFSSRVVPDNGFNPVWSEAFTFRLTLPEVAVVYIAVHDQLLSSLGTAVVSSVAGGDSGARGPSSAGRGNKALLGYAAVPVAALRPGYRSLQLRSALGKKIPFCSLLCRFQRL